MYYNSFILSQIAERYSKKGESTDFLKHISPIQWGHIDMYGHFDFGDTPNENELNSVKEAIARLDFMLFY